MQRQPDRVRGFLLQTSVLDRMSGALCDAVTGQDGGKAMLEALERGNLFVVPLDDRRQWYRYHRLFADVLHGRLRDEQPDQMAHLHRRASAWYERNGEPSEAIRHALAAEDFEQAARLIELEARATIRRSNQSAAGKRWRGEDYHADTPNGNILINPSNGTPMNVPMVDKHFAEIRDSAGLDQKRLHGLRRVFTALLDKARVSERVTMKAAGHKTAAMTRYYQDPMESQRMPASPCSALARGSCRRRAGRRANTCVATLPRTMTGVRLSFRSLTIVRRGNPRASARSGIGLVTDFGRSWHVVSFEVLTETYPPSARVESDARGLTRHAMFRVAV